MAKKIEIEVQKYVKEYSNLKGIFYRVSVPDGGCGQIRRQGFLSKSEAVQFAAKTYLKILTQEKGLVISGTKIDFSEYSAEWLQKKRYEDISEATMMRYQDFLDSRLVPYFGHFKLQELEKTHLRNYIADMRAKNESSANLRSTVTLFKSIIRTAEVDDLIPVKGITAIPTPKHKQKEAQFWDQSQINFFLNAAKDNKYFELFKLVLFSGMRAGEVAGLKWECVHIDKSFGSYQGAIEVRRTFNQKTRCIQETTKNGDKRVIPILPQAKEVLLKLKADAKGPFVFGSLEPLDSSHFNRFLQAALRSAPELPRISFHGLRHSFCSYLDSTGMNRRMVSQIMGHRDLNTTGRYSHVNDSMLGNETARWLQEQGKQKSSNLRTVNFGNS